MTRGERVHGLIVNEKRGWKGGTGIAREEGINENDRIAWGERRNGTAVRWVNFQLAKTVSTCFFFTQPSIPSSDPLCRFSTGAVATILCGFHMVGTTRGRNIAILPDLWS